MKEILRCESDYKQDRKFNGEWWRTTGYEVCDEDGCWWTEYCNQETGELAYLN